MPDEPTRNIDTVYALATRRKIYFQRSLDDYTKERPRYRDDAHMASSPQETDDPDRANLIASEVRPGVHMPVIDCDYGIQTVASTTPGHYHLYIDKELTWEQYKALLDGFYAAGLIEKAWYQHALRHQRSYVRLPHIKKPKDTDGNPVSTYGMF